MKFLVWCEQKDNESTKD